jgi:NADH-ubiquinone oxidoreductase chain 4
MSLCILGLFSGSLFGILGSFLMAIGHSFVSSGLFYLVGIFYDRYHTRSVDYFSGLSVCLPNLSFVFFLFIISNFGFPISLNFISEFFIFIGVGSLNMYMLLFLIFYSVLSVAYNLLAYLKVFHGTLNLKILKLIPIDLQKKEFLIVLPLLFLNSFLCFFASTLIQIVTPAILLVLF